MAERADTIGIVGAGPFGLALAAVLGRAERKVLLWTSQEVATDIEATRTSQRMPTLELPASVSAVSDVQEFARRARFLVIAVGSESVRERLRALGEAVDGSHIAVHAIGAFCAPDDKRVSQAISEETAILRTGVIAGPSMPTDLAAGRGTSLLCASAFDEVTSECRRLIGVPQLMRLYRSRDIVGAELASALSGAYTIAVGLADGLEVGIGVRSVLMTRAASEMARLGDAVGADAKTFFGLAGLGNLLVRSSVEGEHQSPSYRLGRSIAAGSAPSSDHEGARAAHAGTRLARSHGLRLAILETTSLVLKGELDAARAAEQILQSVAEEE